jgi:hypothetical protein
VGDGGPVVIVVFCSQAGSPGVSVWSVLTAGMWPSDDVAERVVVEADLDGGVMCARYRLEPRTEELIAAAPRWDRESQPVVVSDFSVRVGERAWLIPGPASSTAARRAWHATGAARSVAAMAATDRRVWLFDVGRAEPDGVLAPLFDEAACIVVFTRGVSEDVARARSRVTAVKRAGGHVMVASTGPADHDRREVEEFLGRTPVHELPADGRLVDDSRQVWSSRRSRRRDVWASGSALAGAVADALVDAHRGSMSIATPDELVMSPGSNGDEGAHQR